MFVWHDHAKSYLGINHDNFILIDNIVFGFGFLKVMPNRRLIASYVAKLRLD